MMHRFTFASAQRVAQPFLRRLPSPRMMTGLAATTTSVTLAYNVYQSSFASCDHNPGNIGKSESVHSDSESSSPSVLTSIDGFKPSSTDLSNLANYVSPADFLPSQVNFDVTTPVQPRAPCFDLKSVVIITRHGSRTPMVRLPNQTAEEFYQVWGDNCRTALDLKKIPCSRGLLTPLGEFQLTSVGYHLRQQYVLDDSFLPTHFDPSTFVLRSTNLPRTQMSLLRMLSGLYPGVSPADFMSHITVLKESEETMYPNHRFCPRLAELFVQSSHTERYKAIAESPSALALRQKFAQAYGVSGDKLGTWVVIGDEMKCRQTAGLPLPVGVTTEMANQANSLAEQLLHHILRGGVDEVKKRPSCASDASLWFEEENRDARDAARLGMGRMLKEIFGHFETIYKADSASTSPAAISNKSAITAASNSVTSVESSSKSSSSPPRCMIYSGHDTTLAPLLNALRMPQGYENKWPVFASNVIIELLEKKEESEEDDKKQSVTKKHPSPPLANLPQPAHDSNQNQSSSTSAQTNSSSSVATTPSTSSTPISTSTSIVNSSPSTQPPRWWVRVLVNHREMSLLPFEDLSRYLVDYFPVDYEEECKQVLNTAAAERKHSW